MTETGKIKVRCKYRISNNYNEPGCSNDDCYILVNNKDFNLIFGSYCTDKFKQISPFNANRFYVDWTTFITQSKHLIKY